MLFSKDKNENLIESINKLAFEVKMLEKTIRLCFGKKEEKNVITEDVDSLEVEKKQEDIKVLAQRINKKSRVLKISNKLVDKLLGTWYKIHGFQLVDENGFFMYSAYSPGHKVFYILPPSFLLPPRLIDKIEFLELKDYFTFTVNPDSQQSSLYIKKDCIKMFGEFNEASFSWDEDIKGIKVVFN